MSNKPQNCWDFMKCERQSGGAKVKELGICPAAYDSSYSGINSGRYAGRICWAVAGTLCGGKVQGTFAEKRNSCLECSFYKKVRSGEGILHLRTKFLKFITENNKNPIWDKLSYRLVKPGERFVTQGEIEDTAYIIQRGACLVIVEKDGNLHPVDHYGQGDIVGGLGILTGEPRRAHVEAETDMELWVLKRSDFEDISKNDPEILNLLTEIVADRYDSRRPTAYRTIGKHVATDIIGRGGYSIVYKGVHNVLDLPVAIKMMRHNMAMDQDFLNGFRREAKTIACLSHDNIVKIYDIEERYRTLFIIMEYVEGDSLDEMINRLKSIPATLAANFLSQICSALDYAHRKGIVHRDINPTNIIVQRNDRIKILDFGLACPMGTEDFSNAGTGYYMAPEQTSGDPVDSRTDIYAVGICAYEMVTGQKPFSAEEIKALLHGSDRSWKVADPADKIPDLPDELRQFILKASHPDPEQRYQDASQARDSLRTIAKESGLIKDSANKDMRRATFSLIYKDDQKTALHRLVEEFNTSVIELGCELNIAYADKEKIDDSD